MCYEKCLFQMLVYCCPSVRFLLCGAAVNPAVELAQLRRDVARLEDRIRRLTEEVASEVAIVQAYIDTGRIESRDTTKRRLSRLRGALKYPGVIG